MLSRWLAVLVVFASLGSGATANDAAPWSSDDYFRHYMLHYHGKVPLPHQRNAEQGRLFMHITDARNISSILSDAGPPDSKLIELRKILALVGAYRASYNLAVIYGEPLEQELVAVQRFGLEVATAVVRLSRGGDRVPCGAITTMIAGMIESVGEDQRYSATQSAEIAEAIALYYPQIAPVLEAGDRARLLAKAEALDVRVTTDRQRAAVKAMWSVIASGP